MGEASPSPNSSSALPTRLVGATFTRRARWKKIASVREPQWVGTRASVRIGELGSTAATCQLRSLLLSQANPCSRFQQGQVQRFGRSRSCFEPEVMPRLAYDPATMYILSLRCGGLL